MENFKDYAGKYGREVALQALADYISSGVREDLIKFLRKTADRLEQNQDIPRTRGNA